MDGNLIFWIMVVFGVILALAGLYVYLKAFIICAKQDDIVGLIILSIAPILGVLGAVVMLPFVGVINEFVQPYADADNTLMIIVTVLFVLWTGFLTIMAPHITSDAAIGPRGLKDVLEVALMWLYLGAAICFVLT